MKKSIILATTLCSVMLLAACGGNSSNKQSQKKEQVDASSLPIKTDNKKKALKGGELEVGVVTDSQFKGVFSPEYYQDANDFTFMNPAVESLFSTDGDFKITNDGAATFNLDKDKKVVTIKLKDNVKWSDGKPVTADDLIFPYEVIANKDYTGVRYDSTMAQIVGIDEYHEGKANTISGIKKVDDQTISVQFKEINPSIEWGDGIWSYAMPKHAFEGVAIKDMESSDAIRKHPLFFGPYAMSKIVPGESVEFTANEYYWNGKPNIEKITFKAVPSSSAIEALKAKQFDMMLSMPTADYTKYKDVKGYTYLGRPELSYTYLGFKLGKWNDETKSVETNPNAKMADKALRQAMGYAVDNDAVGKQFYAGLRSNANSLIPPVFKTLYDSSLKGYTYDEKKANELLDKAGYKDVDGDKIREDKKGKKLTIKFASMDGGDIAQPLAEYYIQQWKKIGLDVQLTNGRLLEFNSFYEKLQSDDPEIDVYQAAWGTGTNPDPSDLYGATAQFNYTRFASEENTKLLNNILSEKAFDSKYQKNAYRKWQEYASDEAYVIPTLFRNEVLPVSERVVNWDWSYEPESNVNNWVTVGVSSEKR